MQPSRQVALGGLAVFFMIWLAACQDKVDEEAVDVGQDEIVIFIEAPFNESVIREGKTVAFVGSAGTVEGELTGERLVWRSNIDGIIGSGQTFERADLSPGKHEITLSAKGESGRTYANSVMIEIMPATERVAAADDKNRSRPRLVRDPVDGRPYIDTGKGTVVDMTTGLMWEKRSDNRPRDLKGALDYAKKLKLHGYSDWRLPYIEELRYISNLYLDQYNRNAHLGDKDYIHAAVICSVFDTAGGLYWALDSSGNLLKTKNKWYSHTIAYEFDSKYSRLVATQVKTEIVEPAYTRCVRKCDLSQWKRYLAQN